MTSMPASSMIHSVDVSVYEILGDILTGKDLIRVEARTPYSACIYLDSDGSTHVEGTYTGDTSQLWSQLSEAGGFDETIAVVGQLDSLLIDDAGHSVLVHQEEAAAPEEPGAEVRTKRPDLKNSARVSDLADVIMKAYTEEPQSDTQNRARYDKLVERITTVAAESLPQASIEHLAWAIIEVQVTPNGELLQEVIDRVKAIQSG
jgi:hypothetical protein